MTMSSKGGWGWGGGVGGRRGAETGEHFAQIIFSIFSLLAKHVKILL